MTDDNNFRIIVIDDNPSIHADFIKILSTNNTHNKALSKLASKILSNQADQHEQNPEIPMPIFEVDTAFNGIEGLKKIELSIKEGRPYALAFVDVRMPPGMDGIETIKKFRLLFVLHIQTILGKKL
jgi:CheY-like chemotaxis protein